MILYPYPQELKFLPGTARETEAVISLDASLAEEEYFLTVDESGTAIRARGPLGIFRAQATLEQIRAQKNDRALSIHDWPAIPHRAVMMDISRSKIPSLDTLKKLVDWLAKLKINEFQVYMEGYPFAYAHYPEVWKDATPLTPEEIRELDAYCKERFVELVPNQNCFGHMSPWLVKPEFRHLAECPDGFIFANEHWGPTCLAPADPESFAFAKNLFDDLLPCFSSDTVNICCDETLELGQGKTKALCEEKGTENVYFEYLLKVIEYVKTKKKKVQFWGDIIAKAPELLKDLPEDVIPLNWGYSKLTPSEENCRRFQEINLPFYNAPGTNSWNTILGNTDTMFQNVDNAVYRTLAYGGIGVIMTDWGDLNHPQYLPFSYPGFAYAAAMSWNADPAQKSLLAPYLNKFVFKDPTDRFADLMLDAGRYHAQADFSATKRGFVIGILYYALDEKSMAENGSIEEKEKLEKYLDAIDRRLEGMTLECDDADLILDEFRNALRIMHFTCRLFEDKLDCFPEGSKEAHRANIKAMQDVVLAEHARLWRARNKESDLQGSLKRIGKIWE